MGAPGGVVHPPGRLLHSWRPFAHGLDQSHRLHTLSLRLGPFHSSQCRLLHGWRPFARGIDQPHRFQILSLRLGPFHSLQRRLLHWWRPLAQGLDQPHRFQILSLRLGPFPLVLSLKPQPLHGKTNRGRRRGSGAGGLMKSFKMKKLQRFQMRSFKTSK